MREIVQLTTLAPEQISRFLQRQRRGQRFDFEIRFDQLFRDILLTANEFVPSEAGSILLDDPADKIKSSQRHQLIFIACFGERADQLLGHAINAEEGIAGKTYTTGQPYKSEKTRNDRNFSPLMDQKLKFTTRSIVSVPIIIEQSVCGVLELINRRDNDHYTNREMELLRIFAGYISTSIQNALETRRSKELSRLDDLTGLFNDRYFHYSLEQAILQLGNRYTDLGLIFFDLDHFKDVNDKHGHLVGSRVLHEVGQLLHRLMRKQNTILSRYGGDEFVAILPDHDLRQLLASAEKIRSTIARHTFLKNRGTNGDPALCIQGVITASLGVASFRQHCRVPGGIKELQNQFISLADKAMYKAKQLGRNRVEVAKT